MPAWIRWLDTRADPARIRPRFTRTRPRFTRIRPDSTVHTAASIYPMGNPTRELGERIVRRCRELGFAAAGVADASPTSRAAELKAWLAQGKHGDMAFLERTLATLLDPAQELPGVRSVIMVADLYTARNQTAGESSSPAAPLGKVARYAQGKDYHAHIKKRLHVLNDELRILHPGHKFRTFTDTAPVLEREYAHRAGLGWIGKHTLEIGRAHV